MTGSVFESVDEFDIRRKAADDEQAGAVERSAAGRRLTVGGADDPEERRADRVADHALGRLVANALASSGPPQGSTTRIRRSTNSEVVGRGGGQLDAGASKRVTARLGRGAPLAPEVLTNVQRLDLGDLSDVKIHTDGEADTIARSMQADAFTVNRDVFFAAGQYRPDTHEGSRLALHEFSHAAENGTSSSGEPIHRRVNHTTNDVDAVRAKKGKLASGLGKSKDGLDPIRLLIKAYHLSEPRDQPWYAEQLTAACEAYLDQHTSTDRGAKARRALVEDIFADARLEHSRNQAQAEYVRAANTAPSLDAVSTGGLWNQSDKSGQVGLYNVHSGAAALGAGTTARGMFGANEAALAQVQELGLTEAEVLAIRTYTAGDFSYINSGIASSRQTTSRDKEGGPSTDEEAKDDGQAGWFVGVLDGRSRSEGMSEEEIAELHATNLERREGRRDAKGMPTDAKAAAKWAGAEQLREEAALHAGVLMQALAKMPDVECPTYRGSTRLPSGHDRVGGTFTFPAFTSTSRKLYTAESFTAGIPGAVIYELDVKYGRDLSLLSVFGATEGEVLLLPGAEFRIDSVERADGEAIRIKATQLVPGTTQRAKEEELKKLLAAGGSTAR